MRTMLVLDDDLVHIAQELTGVVEKSALVREGLMALIERESSRRAAKRNRHAAEPEDVAREIRRKVIRAVLSVCDEQVPSDEEELSGRGVRIRPLQHVTGHHKED
jgi:Arc/MetJ family transcription regulator